MGVCQGDNSSRDGIHYCVQDLGCISVLENLLSMCKALDSITITTQLKIKYVNKNLWKEAVSSETDWLIRTVVIWRGWNAVGPEPSYTLFWASHSLPTSVLNLTSCDQ